MCIFFCRILIKIGILIHGFVQVMKSEGDIGPPSLTTNYLAAIKKLATVKGEITDPVIMATLFHSTTHILHILEKTQQEEMEQNIVQILKSLKDYKTKNSPIYSQLVEVLWTSFYKLVLYNVEALFIHLQKN